MAEQRPASRSEAERTSFHNKNQEVYRRAGSQRSHDVALAPSVRVVDRGRFGNARAMRIGKSEKGRADKHDTTVRNAIARPHPLTPQIITHQKPLSTLLSPSRRRFRSTEQDNDIEREAPSQ